MTTVGSDERVELEPGVFLVPASRVVVFERRHVTWPVPDDDAAKRLRRLTAPGDDLLAGEAARCAVSVADTLHAAAVLDAYERLIWDDRDTRQQVVRCVRKALGWFRAERRRARVTVQGEH
jgi:hypothetical protein